MKKTIGKSVSIAKTPAFDFGLIATSSALMLAAILLRMMS